MRTESLNSNGNSTQPLSVIRTDWHDGVVRHPLIDAVLVETQGALLNVQLDGDNIPLVVRASVSDSSAISAGVRFVAILLQNHG